LSIELITPPVAEPVTTAQLMQQMGFGTVSDSTLNATLQAQLTIYLVAARRNIESYLRRVLVTQHWLLRLNEFHHHGIELPQPPLQSIDFFQYVDTFANTDYLYRDITFGQNFPSPYGYQLQRGSETQPGYLYPPWAKPWPPTLRVPSAVMVQFRCGYGGPAVVSMAANSAVLEGFTFNPDDAPLMAGETGTWVTLQVPDSNGVLGPLKTNVVSVDGEGNGTLAYEPTAAIENGQAWIGRQVPQDILNAIYLTAQFYYEQASVGGDVPGYIKDSISCYRHLT
jgi:hypothetical protein